MALTDIITALIAFAGTLIGSLSGILAANKLTSYRIAQLEKKVEKHNNLVERMFCVENSVKSAHRRIDDMREEIKAEKD
ncbi:MAG: hypothetical protein IJT03_02350 [Clostridia bacterium]|nr:hypothetical protein [Clostridia bacterium]